MTLLNVLHFIRGISLEIRVICKTDLFISSSSTTTCLLLFIIIFELAGPNFNVINHHCNNACFLKRVFWVTMDLD